MTKKWKLIVTTKHCVYSVKDAQLYVRLIGDKESTSWLKLKSKYSWENDPLFRLWERDPVETYFTRNASKTKKKNEEEGKQQFEVTVPEGMTIDRVKHLEIGHDPSRFVDGWLLGTVTLQNNKGQVIYFNGPKTYGFWQRGVMTLNAESFLKGEEKEIPHRYVMGPVLGFRGISGMGDYQLSALVVTEGVDTVLEPLEFQVFPITATTAEVLTRGFSGRLTEPLAVCGKYKLWRYDWEVPRDREQDHACRYTLPDGRTFSCFIPSKFRRPRLAFASCAGFESQEEIRESTDSDLMWLHMRNAHEQKPIHFLVMGGNQVYADPVVVNILKEHRSKGFDESNIVGVHEEAVARYFELYVSRWRQPEIAFMLSRIPSIMMWDDHDIYSSWGTLTTTPVLEEIYRAAREMFILFQLRGSRMTSANDPIYQTIGIRHNQITWLHPPKLEISDAPYDSGPFTFTLSIEETWFLFLDLRSERNSDQVMSDHSWRELTSLLDVIDNVHHMFVVVGKPPIYGDFSNIVSVAKRTQLKDYKNLYENHVDHWSSPNHDFDRKRLFKLLLDFSRKKSAKVTVLSGNVNVGSWAKLQSGNDSTMIDLLTSSGIVNRAPPAIPLLFETFPDKESFYLPGHGEVTAWTEEIAWDQKHKKYITSQNFLLLSPTMPSAGVKTGQYDVTFVKKPNPAYDKNHDVLKDPKMYSNIL
ncbi:uncharacterized protein LOC144434195 [Glandiceps talaboti]